MPNTTKHRIFVMALARLAQVIPVIMEKQLLTYKSTRQFSDLVLDYLEGSDQLRPFFNRAPDLDQVKAQIQEKSQSFPPSSRAKLVQALIGQYQDFSVNESFDQRIKLAIQALSGEKTFTVTTGHQLNLFTGPLYFLHKIVSTINFTKELKDTYPDYNFVPIYWMASEDHDFDEINYFNFRGKKIQWNREDGGAVGRFNTDGLEAVLNIISAEFGEGRYAKQLKSWFKDAYINHDNLADATRYLANALFAEYGLVIIDADDRELKRLFIPQMQKELLEQTSYTTVKETNSEIETLGLNIQVNPREINLFYLDENLRERIVFEGDIFKVKNTDLERKQLDFLLIEEGY